MKPYYQDDAVTIYHGDCREIVPTLGKFDLLLTDPPYGIKLENHARGKERRDMDWRISGDECQAVGCWLLENTHGCPTIAFASPMKPWPGKWRQFLVWEKGEHVSGGGDPKLCWKPSWELIQVRNTFELSGSRDGAVLRFMAHKEDYANHPSPKPVELVSYLIMKTTKKGQTILDPFAGSGTTGRAAKDLGRKATLIEIEERYCEIAAKRMAQEVLNF